MKGARLAVAQLGRDLRDAEPPLAQQPLGDDRAQLVLQRGETLPVGAQLMGNANSEPLLVCLAAQLESELRWDLRTPERWW